MAEKEQEPKQKTVKADAGAFKRFLESAPDFDALKIERPREPAPSAGL